MATEWGSILSGIGSIAGGFGLGGGSKPPSLGKQMRYHWLDLAESPARKVAGLKKAGIHPVYGFGSSSSWSPQIAVGGSRYDPAAIGGGMGQIAEALNKKQKQSPVGRAASALGLRQMNADVRRSEIEAEMAYMELQRQKQALNVTPTAAAPPASPSPRVKTVPREVTASAPGDKSREAGAAPGWKRYQLANGRYIDMPAHMDPDELASPGMLQMMMKHYGLLKGYDDPSTMTRETHKAFKRWGYRPKKRKLRGQMGRRRY